VSPKRLATEDLVKRARKIHGDRYDYSKTHYRNSETKVIITCQSHGDFLMTMGNHTHKTRPQNCPKCMKVHRFDTDEWINHSKSKFGNKFDYSKTVYVNARTKLVIKCDIHGDLLVDPTNHMISPTGCERCSSQQTGLSQRRTQGSLIAQFISQHGDRYDYSKVDYKGDKNNILIICKEHGEFWQRAIAHANGRNCNKCMNEQVGLNSRLTRDEFIERSNQVHEGKYDYSKVEYLTIEDYVTIICPIHGGFRQKANNHCNQGNGCWECGQETSGLNRRISDEQWITRFREKHGVRYDYSKFKSNGAENKSDLICKEHGVFLQSPIVHSKGVGCPKCGRDKAAFSRRLTEEELLQKFYEVHGDLYDYSKVRYVTSNDNITIICAEHGEFEQLPHVHMNSKGCPQCSLILTGISRRKSLPDVLDEFREVHGERYDYSKFNYTTDRTKSIISCREHGDFLQNSMNHKQGNGCPKCYGKGKTTEEVIAEFKLVHGDKYDYTKFIYKTSKTKSIIICKEHGEFKQVPYAHLSGQGCRNCSKIGFRDDLEGYYYCLSIHGHGGNWWYKGGISADPQRRAKQVQSSLNAIGLLLDVEVIEVIKFKEGKEARDLETKLLKVDDIRSFTIERFDGSRELFSYNPIEFARSSNWLP
jgi:hypothetical protein